MRPFVARKYQCEFKYQCVIGQYQCQFVLCTYSCNNLDRDEYLIQLNEEAQEIQRQQREAEVAKQQPANKPSGSSQDSIQQKRSRLVHNVNGVRARARGDMKTHRVQTA